MKQFLALCISLVIISCSSNSNQDGLLSTDVVNNPSTANGKAKGPLPDVKFEKETHDFGDIKSGDKVTCEFKFTNTGKADLIIGNARGSCGCTVPDYPTEPIAPGEDGVIKVAFNSSGKSGFQTKTVTLVTNCIPATKIISIKANVLAE